MTSVTNSIGWLHQIARRSVESAASLTFVVVAVASSNAQQAVPQPHVDFSRTERRFDAFNTEQQRTRNATVPLPRAERPQISGDTKPLFKLRAVDIDGARALPDTALTEAFAPYLGKTVSQADLTAMTAKISAIYRAAGFHLSRAIVPPQDVSNDRIRIRVIEGRIAEVVVKGERVEKVGIGKLLDRLTRESPARRETFERQLLLVNDLPGVRLTDTELEEIGDGSGRFRLVVQVETWLNYTAVSLDNRGTTAIGPLQAYLSSSFNSTVVPGDMLGVNLSTVPDTTQELKFARLSYNAPIGLDGARVGVTAAVSDIRPGDLRRTIDTVDRAQVYELKGSIVPLRSRDSSLWLTAAATYSDFRETDVFGLAYQDRTRTVSLTLDYQARDPLDGWNYLTLTGRQGLGILDASRKGDDYLSRWDGSGVFSKLEFSYTRYQPITDAWSLKLSAAGQLSSTALLGSQEFYLGAAFGRGYWGADFSGDNAIGGSAELRFDQVLANDFVKGYQLYGFVDKTVAWNFHSEGSNPLVLSLVGVGARAYLANQLQAGVEVAVPLEYRTPMEQSHNPRAFFYVSQSFKLCPGSARLVCS